MAKIIESDIKLLADLRDLSEEVRKLPRTSEGKIRRVPIALQERIIEVKERWGLGHEPLGKRIGITGTSIRQWWKRREYRREAGGFKAVTVVADAAPVPRAGLTLELACGARITGLSLNDVRGLLAGAGQ